MYLVYLLYQFQTSQSCTVYVSMVTRLLLLQFACTTREPVDVGFNNVVKKKRKNKTKQKKRQVILQEARFPYLTKSCLSLGYI